MMINWLYNFFREICGPETGFLIGNTDPAPDHPLTTNIGPQYSAIHPKPLWEWSIELCMINWFYINFAPEFAPEMYGPKSVFFVSRLNQWQFYDELKMK